MRGVVVAFRKSVLTADRRNNMSTQGYDTISGSDRLFCCSPVTRARAPRTLFTHSASPRMTGPGCSQRISHVSSIMSPIGRQHMPPDLNKKPRVVAMCIWGELE